MIISESEILPLACLELFSRLAKNGLPVIFTEKLPQRASEGGDVAPFNNCFEEVPTNELAAVLRERGLTQLCATGKGVEYLRFYHATREHQDVYIFSNEAINSDLHAEITIQNKGDCLVYDPWDNRVYRDATRDGKLSLHLEKGNLLIYIFGTECSESIPQLTREQTRVAFPLLFEIAVMEEEKDEFTVIAKDSLPFDITAYDRLPHFSGTVRYRTSFEAIDGFTVLDLGQVGEIAEVWLNGVPLGVRINAPYKFSLLPALRDGKNELEIRVVGNLAHRRNGDRFSRYVQVPPTGIIGEIALCRYSGDV